MNRKRLVTAIGVIGVAMMTGCPPDQDLKDYLKEGGPLNSWLAHLQGAVCQLESKATGLDPAKMAKCDPTGPPDVKPPPAYPPK